MMKTAVCKVNALICKVRLCLDVNATVISDGLDQIVRKVSEIIESLLKLEVANNLYIANVTNSFHRITDKIERS